MTKEEFGNRALEIYYAQDNITILEAMRIAKEKYGISDFIYKKWYG